MKPNYDKKGLQLIAIAFIISTIINSIVENNSSITSIFFTMAVFLPYLIILLGSFLYYYIKNKEIFIFSDYRVIYGIALFEFFVLYGKSN
jgi:hypothetical protein